MSPKKKRKNRTPRDGRSPSPGREPADPPPVRTVSRTPVVLDAKPRWPVAVWSAAAFVWVVGTALFFVLYLAEGFAMLGEARISDAARRATAWYLIGLLVCALLVPLGAGIAAALMRRRIAAIGFAVALAASAIGLFSLASPAEFAMGIGGAFG